MRINIFKIITVVSLVLNLGCKKSNTEVQPIAPVNFIVNQSTIDGLVALSVNYNVSTKPIIKISFSNKINLQTVSSNILLKDFNSGNTISCNYSSEKNDSIIVMQPINILANISKFNASISTSLKSVDGGNLITAIDYTFNTKIDSTNKFPLLADTALLTLVQKQTFTYFWNFGHPISGMARERNTSGDIVALGGTGFGIMSMLVAINRGFISRTDGLNRISTITNFLATKCTRLHGAFSHWINGSTGAIVPFGSNNGVDIVETSYLLEGLLCAMQYCSNTDIAEKTLRDSINSIWNKVEWNWFTQNGAQQSLYWQYNPSYTASSDIWSIAVTGWNEALITYVLSASSTTYPISKNIYDAGWARNGAIRNGNSYYGITLPLGQAYGGPLFFEHYSFLGINPNGLSDAYANYQTQTLAHTLINYNYCVTNPKQYFGYSSACWGLTASDIQGGYTASSPTNDKGFISPTAAISSLPYTPNQSLSAIKFFYYALGDKLWGDYGFYDAFSLSTPWFASSNIAIDQGPEIVMIENYRSGFVWNLFTSCPEVKTGMKKLGFAAPYL